MFNDHGENSNLNSNNKFLENISHEIRTYINGIIGMTDLTLMTNLNSEQKENLNLVKTSALKLLDITSDVLDFSKIQSKQMKLENIEFNFKEFVNEIRKTSIDKAIERRIDFKTNINDDIPEILMGDPLRIKQMIEYFIDSLIKYNSNGEISFNVEKDEITDKNISLKFKITSNFHGNEKNNANKLSKDINKTISKNYNKNYVEMGLRSIILKGLIEIMGGKIEVKNKKASDTSISFNIILEKARKYSSANATETKSKASSSIKVNKSLNILIVEDDKASQMVIYNLFKKNGHKCDIAENGQQALNMIEDKQYDLILMDIQMPILDGIQTTKMIRKLEENKESHVPIIALTAYALKGDKERFLSIGVDDYVAKPFNMNELLKTAYSMVKTEKTSIHIINKQNNMDEGALFLYPL